MKPTRKQESRAWHAEPVTEVLAALSTTESGLSQADVERRLQLYGPNLLPERGATPLWKILLRQFASPLIYILVAAAVVSVLIGDVKDAAFIAAVLALNAVIGTYQEWQAEQSSHALKKLLRMHAQVERDSEVREIMAEEVVPGDVLWLESGNRVPADIRLLSTQGLEVDESLLTGESLAVGKDHAWMGQKGATLADRQNMTFAGSLVARGRAKGVVVATGTATNVGQLALDVMGSGGGRPPLLARMERFTNYVAVGTLGAAAIIGTLGMGLGGYTLVETFFLVVALAVSAIPEGLPVAITVALAVATTRMARRNVIVRQLTAVEGLGSCTLIATDKTGTLTCNELTVREVCLPDGEVFPVTGQGFSPAGEVLSAGRRVELTEHSALAATIRAAVLCNEASLHHRDGEWVWRGDAVDIAALSLGIKAGMHREQMLDAVPQVSSIPFEPEHQFAASFHRSGELVEVFVKGAPERVLDMCGSQLSATDRTRSEQVAVGMAARGLRVLAVASSQLAVSPRPEDVPPQPENLILHGFLGMIDPLRAGAREAVADCHRAGVLVSMGAAELLMVLLAVVTGLPVPLLPVQLLWLNLVTNGIQGVALAFEPCEGDSLRRKPRPPNEAVFNQLMVQRTLMAMLVVGGGGFLVYDIALRMGWTVSDARNLLLLTMVLFENFHIGNCRSETRSAFALSPLRSPVLFFGTLGAFLIHVAAMYVPFLQNTLSTSPVNALSWSVAIGVSMLIVPAIELHKWWWASRVTPAET